MESAVGTFLPCGCMQRDTSRSQSGLRHGEPFMISRTLLGHMAALMTILVWGTTFVSTKILLRDLAPLEILFFRFLVGYLSLFLFRPRFLGIRKAKDEMLFAAAGLCGVTLYFLLENIALTYTLAANVGIIICLAPFFTAMLACLFLRGEHLQPRFFAGLFIALAGVVLIAFNGNTILRLNPLGDILAALAALVWAIYSILMRRIGELGLDTVLCTRRVFFYGLLFMLPALPFLGFTWKPDSLAELHNLLNLLYLGFGASALCFVTWNWTVRVLGAVRTSAYIYLMPVVTVLSAAIILNERLTGLAIFGTALTLIGLLVSEGRIPSYGLDRRKP